MYNFEYPLFFLLIIPILFLLVLLYFLWFKNKTFSNFKYINKFYKKSYFYEIYILVIFIISIIFISILSRPFISNSINQEFKKWIDIQIVLDISYSMIATDMLPSRIDVAKNVINWFLNELNWDRVWIIVFSWKTFSSVPLNFNYNIIQKIVNRINVSSINKSNISMQWTAMWDALILSSKSFWINNDREKIIILITDWETNKWIPPLDALNYLEKNNLDIKVYTIWLGWYDDTFIEINNDYLSTKKLKVWWLNEEILIKIWESTWWKYFRADDENSLKQIFKEISLLEKKEIVTNTLLIRKEQYNILIILLVFSFITFFSIKLFKKI